MIEVGVDCGVLNLGETNAKAVDPCPEQCRIVLGMVIQKEGVEVGIV